MRGCESLNPEFVEYVRSTADYTPPECPLVLNIIGDCLSQEEKNTIEKIIFMGDTLCDYIFLTGHDLRKSRRLVGRLASIKVIFSDSYVDPNYTDTDFNELYSEIEKDVNATIEEE